MKLFNRGLYKEGLRKNLLIGLSFTILFVLAAIFISITSGIDASNYYLSEYGKKIISGTQFYYLLLSFSALAPLSALNLFSFLNKRNSSDFYHSIPHKRETLFVSYFLSAVTWLLIATVLSSLLSIAIFQIFSTYVELNFVSVFGFILNMLAGSLLILSATALAMGITGTMFSNIVTALLIIFMPRVLIAIFTNNIASAVFVIPSNGFGLIGDYSNNIPINTIVKLFSNSSSNVSEISLSGVLYTLILGMIYFALAVIAFKIRKSESAGYPSQNKLIQSAVRIAVCFLICTIPCSILSNGSSYDSVILLTVLILYMLAVFAYFVYEAISTKGFKSLGKAAPGLLVVVLLNIAFIGGSAWAKSSILNYKWDANNIESFAYSELLEHYYDKSYESLKLSEMMIPDSNVKEIIAEVLNEQSETVKKNISLFDESTHQDTIQVKMKNGSMKYRNLFMSSKQYSRFVKAIEKAGYLSAEHWHLPEKYTGLELSISGNYVAFEELEEIYQILKQEVEDNNIEPKYYIQHPWMDNTDEVWSTVPAINIYVKGTYGSDTFYSTYLISEKTPKTLQAVKDLLINESRINAVIEKIDSNDLSWLEIIDLNNSSFYFSMGYDSNVLQIDDGILKELKTALQEQITNEIDLKNNLISITCLEGHGNHYSVLLNIDDDLMEKLMESEYNLWSVEYY